MDECEVDYWVDFGTLLGLHRDKEPVPPSDTDIDIQLPSWEMRDRLLKCDTNKNAFHKRGLHFDRKRNPNGGLQAFDGWGAYCDIDTWVAEGPSDKLRCRTLPHCQDSEIDTDAHSQFCRISPSVILPTHRERWGGKAIRVPHRVERLLTLRYGAGWRVPRRYDKGTDTTPWDTFKAMQLWWALDIFFAAKTLVMVASGAAGAPPIIVVACASVGAVVAGRWGVRRLRRRQAEREKAAAASPETGPSGGGGGGGGEPPAPPPAALP